MMGIPALEYNKTLERELHEVVRPLSNLGIDYFAYYKIYKKSNQCLVMTTLPDNIFEYHLTHKTPIFSDPIIKAQAMGKYTFLWPDGQNKALTSIGINTWDGINFYLDHTEFMEVWTYSKKLPNTQSTESYINSLSFLEKYVNHFKNKISDMVKPDESCLLDWILPNFQNHQSDSPLPSLTDKRYRLEYEGTESYLTSKEFKCLIYLGRGCSTKEIAKKLSIDSRTVETHFQKIKAKYNLGFLTDLRKFALLVNNSFYFEE